MGVIVGVMPDDMVVSSEVISTAEKAALKVLEIFSLSDAEVSITVTDNENIHYLNKEYRHIDRPTDVLSFALQEAQEPTVLSAKTFALILGDIIISLEKATEQAAEYGHSLQREIAFLTVHGMLHLLGYDHMDEENRKKMQHEEKRVMEELNILRQ